MGEGQCGLMEVTQWKGCHENDETASVRRVRCRDSSHDAESMVMTSACEESQHPVYSAQMSKLSALHVNGSVFIVTGCHSSLSDHVRKNGHHTHHMLLIWFFIATTYFLLITFYF